LYRPNRDVLGLFLQLITHVAISVILIGPIFACCFHLDPVHLFLITFVPNSYKFIYTKPIFFFLRVLILTAVAFEVGIAGPLSILLACVGLRFLTDAVSAFDFLHKSPVLYFRRINSYRCVQRIIENLANMALFCICSGCFAITIISTFASIKLYDVIPMPVFLAAPAAAVIAPAIALCVIIPVVFIHERSSKSLHVILVSLGSTKYTGDPKVRRYFLKKLRCTNALAFYAGIDEYRFVLFQRSTKKAYLEITLYFTITFLLSVPADSLLGSVV
jgi:hypothetical protein